MKLLIGFVLVLFLVFLWKEKKRGLFWGVLILSIIAWVFVANRPAFKDEYYIQRIECLNGKYFRIIHHGKCYDCSSWGAQHGKILDFQKWVIDLYCPFCLSEYEIDKLEAISKNNILQNHFSDESQDYILEHLEEYTKDALDLENLLTSHLLDTTSRTDFIHYCFQKGAGYSGILLPTDLPEKYSYLQSYVK